MSVQTMKIDLFGVTFTIQTDESREYIETILAYIRERADTVRRASRVEDPLKASILASVYIVDELFRERERSSDRVPDAEELGRITERIIARIDKGLGDLTEDGSP